MKETTQIIKHIEWSCGADSSPTTGPLHNLVLLAAAPAGWYRASVKLSVMPLGGNPDGTGFEAYLTATRDGVDISGEDTPLAYIVPGERPDIQSDEKIFKVDVGTDIRWHLDKETGTPEVMGLLAITLEQL